MLTAPSAPTFHRPPPTPVAAVRVEHQASSEQLRQTALHTFSYELPRSCQQKTDEAFCIAEVTLSDVGRPCFIEQSVSANEPSMARAIDLNGAM